MPAGKGELVRFAARAGKVLRALAGCDHIRIGDPGNGHDAGLRTGDNNAGFFHGLRTRIGAPEFRARTRAKTFDFDSIANSRCLRSRFGAARQDSSPVFFTAPGRPPSKPPPRKNRGRAGRQGSGAHISLRNVRKLKCSDPRASTPRDIEACRSPYSRKSAQPKASRARCLLGLLRFAPGGRPISGDPPPLSNWKAAYPPL
jgi:hypothetical protein